MTDSFTEGLMTTEAPVAAPATPAVAPVAPAVGETATPEAKPERTFTQVELDDILEKRLSKERRKREDIQRRLAVTEELALRKREPEPQPKAAPAGGEPKRESYDSYEAFIEARAEWKADQKIEERFKKQSEEEKTRTATENQQKQAQEFKKRTKELAKDISNFDEVMAEATSDPDAPVSRLLAEPIQECENPAAVLYHLAQPQNQDEAERIASLPANKQAREIWALDSKLKSAPVVKKPSNAPEPIAPVGGKASKGDDEPDPKSKEWAGWRNRQIALKRKGT